MIEEAQEWRQQIRRKRIPSEFFTKMLTNSIGKLIPYNSITLYFKTYTTTLHSDHKLCTNEDSISDSITPMISDGAGLDLHDNSLDKTSVSGDSLHQDTCHRDTLCHQDMLCHRDTCHWDRCHWFPWSPFHGRMFYCGRTPWWGLSSLKKKNLFSVPNDEQFILAERHCSDIVH